MLIYTVKTVVGREKIVLESMASRATANKLNIQSLTHPEEIRGYIFVEGDVRDVEKVLQMVPHVRGLIKTPIRIEEIQRFLLPKKMEIELKKGDMVEVIGGPFKGERGKVVKYDKTKREMTMELIEVAVPIPITVSVEFVKPVKRKEQ